MFLKFVDVAVDKESEGDLVLSDMGEGMPFKAGTFDAVISISALQWLCNADKKYHHPPKRLFQFFTTLYACLCRGGKAVFQLYPENSQQLELITQQAMKAGFTGGLVVDFPNSTKAKKMFLCLFAGGQPQQLPKGLGTEGSNTSQNQVAYSDKSFFHFYRQNFKQLRGKNPKKSRDWILEKKERRRRQGKECRPDTKYTGRKRKAQF
ncbi:18S rRNA (guanine1575-N7)-methyltransferase [Mytilus galloprovincialis]|uniref:18S rRNA (Guanine1575-N7)-methyltransferase n=1 Tax=Mytilus galloprovincialis TaxID=29158 RepID=A0A8B6G4A6_MYTGA|nr:18S rRNA (guanine1575-N7)-methyltransferase [Mytilus galloprovincialis]